MIKFETKINMRNKSEHEVEHWMTSVVHSLVCKESFHVLAACLISYDVGMPPSLVVLELEWQWHLYKVVSVDGRPTVRLRQPFLSFSISFLSHFLGFCIDSLDIGKLSYVKFDPHCFLCNLFLFIYFGSFFFIKVIQHWVHWELNFMIFLICLLWGNFYLITRVTGLEG
jgi:hypothetical protein